ncbi:hypothetical protein MMC16_005369 [Acarospora aff. strigata]|nr:hypothetical protein [Acarospora aff. strigata]
MEQCALECSGLDHTLQCGHRVRTDSPACHPNCSHPRFGAKDRRRIVCRDCADDHVDGKVRLYARRIAEVRASIDQTRYDSGASAQEIEELEDQIDDFEVQMQDNCGREAYGRWRRGEIEIGEADEFPSLLGALLSLS